MSRGVVKVDIGVSDQPPVVLGFMNIQNRITPVRLPLNKRDPPVLTTTKLGDFLSVVSFACYFNALKGYLG